MCPEEEENNAQQPPKRPAKQPAQTIPKDEQGEDE